MAIARSAVPAPVPPTLSLRALVLSLVAAYLLLALGLKAVQAVASVPEGSLVEVVQARLASGG